MNSPYIPPQTDLVSEGRYSVFRVQLTSTRPHYFDVGASLGPGMIGRAWCVQNLSPINLAYFKTATPDGKWGEEIIVAPFLPVYSLFSDGLIIGKFSIRGNTDDTHMVLIVPGRLPEPPFDPPARLVPTEGNMARSVLKTR